MIAPEKSPRTNAWAAHLAALGLVPLFGAFATSGLIAQTVSPAPHYANAAFADGDQDDDDKAKDDDKGADKDKAKDDDKDKKDDLGTRLESRLKELGDQLANDLGPAGEELRKVWDRAISRANETLGEEGLSGDGVRDAIDDVRDEISSALEKGSPVDRRVRRALDRLRRELSEAGEESSRELQETVRNKLLADQDKDEAKEEGDNDRHERKDGDAEGRKEIDAARKEVREIQQKLHQAVLRLSELQRHAIRDDRPQGRRRGPGEERRRDSDEARERPRPPETPEAESGRRGRGPREMPAPGMDRRRGGMGRGPFGGPRPGFEGRQQSDNERRFKELEEKMDKILKHLDGMHDKDKSETAPKKAEADSDA